MSLTSEAPTEPVVERANRRKHARRKPDQLIYIDLGSSNGGFLLDISEKGLRFQGITPLRDGQIMDVKFKLPGAKTAIRAEAQFVHSGSSTKEAGLKLLNLPADVQQQIRDWVEQEGGADGSAALGVTTESEGSTASMGADGPVVAAESRGEKASSTTGAEPGTAENKLAKSTPVKNEKVGGNVSVQKEPAEAAEKSAANSAIVKVKPKTKTEKAVTNPTAVKTEEVQSTPTEPVVAAPLPEIKASAASRAANESASAVRQAVLRSKTVKPKSPDSKNAQISQFAAGLAAGCFVLVTIGGGLIVTGRVRLGAPSAVTSVSADSTAPNTQVGPLDLGDRHETIAMPEALSATTPAEQLTQTLPATPALSSAVTSSSVTPVSAAAHPGTETAKPSSRRSSNAASAMQIAMNRPVASGNAAANEASLQVPALSDGSAAPVPVFETRSPEPVRQPTVTVKQSTGPSAAGFPAPAPEPASQTRKAGIGQPTVAVRQSTGAPVTAFAAPDPEPVKQPKQPKPVVAARPSGSTFASPDSAGAGPSNIEPATLVSHSDPVYPQDAHAANVQGTVDILATIGKDGVPRSLTPTNGDSRLAAAAIAAISHWRYRPAMLNGQPEESLITITVTFSE